MHRSATILAGIVPVLFATQSADAQTGIWEESQRLNPSVATARGLFGTKVVVQGDTAFIGAPDTPGAGRVCVLELKQSVWVLTQTLTPSDSERGDLFGAALDVLGDELVVGAWGKDPVGAAYLFRYDGTAWVEEAKLLSADQSIVGSFGRSVAIQAGTIVIGAYTSRFVRPDRRFCASGSAHVFEETVHGWSETQILTANNIECGGLFGWEVELDGGALYVSAVTALSINGSQLASGVVYVFEESGVGWVERQQIVPGDPEDRDHFGSAMAVQGDTAVFGAPWDDDPCRGNAGSAYVFVREAGVWREDQKLLASDCSGYFGDALDLDGDTVVIGAQSTLPAGAAYVFQRTPSGWVEEDKLVATDAMPGDGLGSAVAMIGEEGVLLGASLLGGAFSTEGAAYVFARRTASSTFRSAGANPASYSASSPILGQPWIATVDLTTTGHSHAQVIGHTSAASVTQPGGQVLLIGGPRVFQLPLTAGPIASWSSALPPDPSLAGVSLSTQAWHVSGTSPFALSNAQDLVVGY
jgi:hypothetical protein